MKKAPRVKLKSINLEDVAIMVQKGFEGVDRRFDGVDKRFDGVDKRLDGVDMRLGGLEFEFKGVNRRLNEMERDTKSIKHHLVYREEFQDLMARMKLVEKTIGIVSGK
ncbi:MAG: hypothetical protein COV10_03980 [Candidatus Vogelbacteria bacterium CG10_big_fil_rev_8_21_14_0_10_51_16]|uniref:t-SNARE coiled-coil homology domain-containing protein n=1 Tax=Candidatus Vogelbacteria bacterium CG10_big_fil_rev_8_21_14_0_10_51_16 TaxID=1975045 RepID=A0A2H0RF30_9BACT|nr:MAG: hypothetical protein COV10_03980 [Candidatus Vogelbacteria bacterium CG10_big_fil_rev_8_21_14_0_10_51_16]